MVESELKHKLRNLKKLERKIRQHYLRTHRHTQLVWDSYFSTKSHASTSPSIKYSLRSLLGFKRSQRKQVFEEYLFSVFLHHAQEEGFAITIFQDPEILTFFGLPCYATLADIKKRFRQLAHKYHPDKGGDPEKMIQLLEIYEKCFPKRRE